MNAAFPTSYSLDPSTGNIDAVGRSFIFASNIYAQIAYRAFGPITTIRTASVQQGLGTAGTSNRTLTVRNTYRSDNSLASMDWSYLHSAGPVVSPDPLLSQAFTYTPSGLISKRIDSADHIASRVYAYDSLLRLTCEARGDSANDPSLADCKVPKSKLPYGRMPDAYYNKNPKPGALRPTPHTAGLFTYGDGQSAESPQDVRLTSFVQSEDASYISPSVEASHYASGSSQVQGMTRSGGDLVIGHDALGRRTFDFDARDPVRSRRDYAYLPNGQLGEVSVPTPDGGRSEFAMRYDERGHPVLIRALRIPGGEDDYELFWDDADRLVAANINFTPPRTTPSGTLTSARWHYHYAGATLVAATRELVGSANEAGAKTFWVVSDERGLVHRLVDEGGETYWRARWDASGWRTLVGMPKPEMWVPFGLPGQIVLGQMMIYGPNGDARVLPGTEVSAANSDGTWARPPLALNRWRAYDPLIAFLQRDEMDAWGTLSPEGYAAFRHSPLAFDDPDGRQSSGQAVNLFGYEFVGCTAPEEDRILTAMSRALNEINRCKTGACSPGFSGPNVKVRWQASMLFGNTFVCSSNDYAETSHGKALAYVVADSVMQKRIVVGQKALKSTCLEGTLAHETLHPVLDTLYATDLLAFNLSPFSKPVDLDAPLLLPTAARASNWVDLHHELVEDIDAFPNGTSSAVTADDSGFGHALINPAVRECIGCDR